jgi:CubicO group peptidase (beta-lactamase class C family)
MRIAALLALLALAGCVGLGSPTRSDPLAPAAVRVAFDRNGLTAASASGLADRATRRAVTIDDPVRIASVSKLVVALGVMRLVEQGRLDLDADVSPLLGYRLRNPAFPNAPLTLRLLMSHRSSLTDSAGYALPYDTRLRDALADPKAWDPAHPPGGFFRYANLNFPVIASVMERATGERFDLLMRRLVLAPLKLDACFNWSGCSDAAIARAVVLYGADGSIQRDDLYGRAPPCLPYPARDGSCDLARWRAGENGASFSPQGGLRISMRDLATIGRLLLGEGTLDGIQFLSAASIRTLLAPAWSYDGTNGITGESALGSICRYGLATQALPTRRAGCRDDLFGDGAERVGHGGDAYGLRSGLWIDRAAGTGVAYFVTAVPDESRGRHSAFAIEEERIAHPR